MKPIKTHIEKLFKEKEKEKKRFFKFSLATFIASLSFVISSGVAIFTYYYTVEQNIQNSKYKFKEVLNELTLSMVDKYTNYGKGDNLRIADKVKRFKFQKDLLLIEQAVELFNSLPYNKISSGECISLAESLSDFDFHSKAKEVIDIGETKANDDMMKINVGRVSAKILFRLGKKEEGRKKYEEILKMIGNLATGINTRYYYSTELKLIWADMEAESFSAKEDVQKQLDDARLLLVDLVECPGKRHLLARIVEFENHLATTYLKPIDNQMELSK